jgi:hypothetical protein
MEKKIKYILVAGEASTPSSGSMASSRTISQGNQHPTFTYFTLHFFRETQAYHDFFVYSAVRKFSLHSFIVPVFIGILAQTFC